MDISSLLPLLMSGNKDKSQSDMLSSMLTSATSPQLASILQMANSMKPKPREVVGKGLYPVRNIASCDILGRLAKYFS